MGSFAASAAQTFHLKPFSPVSQDLHLKALVDLSSLQIQFVLQGDLGGLVIPLEESRGFRRDKLWEHTCFECFWGPVGSTAYWELNLSPSRHWALYRFSDYRKDMREENSVEDFAIERVASARELRMGFRLPVELFSGAGFEVSLTTVLEHVDGSRSYWALEHGTEKDKPDFHRRQSFLIRY